MSAFAARIAAVAAKEFRQLARDRLTAAMIVGMPLVQILIFGYGINFDLRGIRAAVVDQARSSYSRALAADLEATQVVRIAATPASVAAMQELIASGEVAVGLYIPPDFERRRLETDRPVAQLFIDGSLPGVEGAARALTAMPLPQRRGMAAGNAPARRFEVRVEYNPERRTAVQVVPALIGVILNMTMVVFTAIALVRERERGNLELLITTPVTPVELMIGKLLPYVLVGLLQTTLILAIGVFLFDVPVSGSVAQLYLGASLFIAATLALGLVISTVAQTQFQAMQLGFFIMLPSILLSGFVFPFQGMPRIVQWIAQALPLTHFNSIVRGVVLRGASLGALGWPLAKLAVFLVMAVAFAALRFRKRLG